MCTAPSAWMTTTLPPDYLLGTMELEKRRARLH